MNAFAFQPTHIPGDGRHSPDRYLEISDDFPGRFSAKHLHVLIFNALEAVFIGERIHHPPKPREAVGERSIQVKYCELLFRHDPNSAVLYYRRFFHPACRNLISVSAFLNRSNYGGENGTRPSALAARRAYTSDPFVVAVLRPLTPGNNCVLRQSGSVAAWRSLIFCSGQRHQTRAFF